MSLLRRKKKPAASRPDDPLNSLPMENALSEVDAHHASIAEFRATIATWQKQYDDFVANGDPTDEQAVRIATFLKSRLEMAPNHLAREVERIGSLVETLVVEVRAFETRLLATGTGEIARLDAAIVPAVRPYCQTDDDALRVARGCGVYLYIPAGRRTLLLGQSIGETERFWHLGHESFPFERVIAEGWIAEAETKLRDRVADLLTTYATWKSRGGQWVPKGFGAVDPAPEMAVV